MRRLLLFCAALLCLLRLESGSLLASEALPATVSLDEVFDLLEHRSPHQSVMRAREATGSARITAARVMPNPTVSYGGMMMMNRGRVGAVEEHEIRLSQPLRVFGQRRRKVETARLDQRLDRVEQEWEHQERMREAARIFYEMLAHQERIRILEAELQDVLRIRQVIQVRHDDGDASRYDLMRLDTEAAAFRAELDTARGELTHVQGELSTLLGFPGWFPIGLGSLVPKAKSLAMAADPKVIEHHPAGDYFQALAERNRAEVKLLRRERLPVPELEAGTLLTRETGGNAFLFGVSLPIVVLDRGQGELAMARAEGQVEAAIARLRMAELKAEREKAVNVYQQRLTNLLKMERDVMENLEHLRRMADDSYLHMGDSLLDLLDAYRSIHAMRLLHLEQQLAVKLAEMDLLALNGWQRTGRGK